MTTIPPRQVDETLTRAREAVLDPDCSPSDVERLLGKAVDGLDAVGVESSAVEDHLNKHREVTGESGFPPQSRRACRDALRRAHRGLRDRFEAIDEPGCLSCGATIKQMDRDRCAECCDSDAEGRADGEEGGPNVGVDRTDVDISKSSDIIIGGENNEIHTHNH